MKCPIIMAGWNATRGGDKTYKPDCIKEECAWWDREQRCCCEVARDRALFALVDLLSEIRDKMPH